jgi:hypothetical protein
VRPFRWTKIVTNLPPLDWPLATRHWPLVQSPTLTDKAA